MFKKSRKNDTSSKRFSTKTDNLMRPENTPAQEKPAVVNPHSFSSRKPQSQLQETLADEPFLPTF